MSLSVTPSRFFAPPPSPSPSPIRPKRLLIEEAAPRTSVQDFINHVITDLLQRGKIQDHEKNLQSPKVLKKVQKEAIRQNLADVFAWIMASRYPLTTGAYAAAGEMGDLPTLQLLQTRGGDLTAKMSYNAALYNQFFFLQHAGKIPMDASTCMAAVHNVEMLKWLRQNNCPWDSRTTAEAAAGGHLESLIFALDNKCPINEIALSWAVHYEKKAIIELLLARGCEWGNDSLLLASAQGNVNAIALAVSLGCPWNTKVCVVAKDLETLAWLREQGCPLSEGVCNQAAATGDQIRLQWAIENKVPLNQRKVYNIAADKGHLHILQWLFNNSTARCDLNKVFEIANKAGHRNIIKWVEWMEQQLGQRKSSSKKRKEAPSNNI